MQFTTFITGLFAAAAAAAPAMEPRADTTPNPVAARTVFDASRLNNLQFNHIDLRYLQGLNAFDLQLFQNLNIRNNLDVLHFQNLFNAQVFDINSLLQLQSLHTLLLVGQTGVFNNFDLRGLQFQALDFGLINGLVGVDLVQFIDTSFRGQIQTVADGGKSFYTNDLLSAARAYTNRMLQSPSRSSEKLERSYTRLLTDPGTSAGRPARGRRT